MKTPILIAAMLAGIAGTSSWGASDVHAADATSYIINVHQTDAVLRKVYAEGKRVNLPRMVLFDGDGRLLFAEVGLRKSLGYRLRRALEKDKPLNAPLSLARVLDDVEDAKDQPVKVRDLPDADAYVVDYWAEWCAPCHEMARDIERQMKRWKSDGKHIVWIKIESDPQKLQENR